MAKRATYNVEFSLEGLTLIEQERFYQKLMSILDQSMKDVLHIKVTDLLGGVHDPFSNKGTRPDGINCNGCYTIDCARCSVWKKVTELENIKKEVEINNE